MRVWRSVAFAMVPLVVACGTGNGEPPTTTQAEPVTTEAPTTTVPLVAGCPEEGEFTEGGRVATIEQTSSDSNTIGLISWEAEEACETFTVTFETSEGAPATTPPGVEVVYLEGAPVIRIALDTDQTVITDQLVETDLVERLYVVRALDGGMFIDLHLAAPAQAHVAVETSPARFILDLQPGIVEHPAPAAISAIAVVVTPLDGVIVPLDVEIEGYTRTFESNVMVIATSGDHVVAEANTTAADSVETWGEFRASVVLPPGDVSLFVGDQSAEDGSLEGVTISLTVQ